MSGTYATTNPSYSIAWRLSNSVLLAGGSTVAAQVSEAAMTATGLGRPNSIPASWSSRLLRHCQQAFAAFKARQWAEIERFKAGLTVTFAVGSGPHDCNPNAA